MKYNQIIGFVLIFVILILFAVLSPSNTDKEKKEAKQETTQKKDTQTVADSANLTSADSISKQTSAIAANKDAQGDDTLKGDSIAKYTYEKNGAFYAALEGTDTFYIIETDLLRLKIASRGASIAQVDLKEFNTWKKAPLNMYYDKTNTFNLAFQTSNALANSSAIYFTPVGDQLTLSKPTVLSGDSMTISFRAPATDAAGKELGAVLFNYTFYKGSYLFNFDVRFENRAKFLDAGSNYMILEWAADLSNKEKSLDNERNVSTIHYCDNDNETDYLSETSDDNEKLDYPVKWVSYKQQFFATTLIAKNKFSSADLTTKTKPEKETDSTYIKSMMSKLDIEFSSVKDSVLSFSYYIGPLKYKTLRQYGLKLERQIPLGWSFSPIAWINRFAVIPVFNWLESYGLSYGIIILILTILLKLVLFPIAMRTYKSSAKMRILKPEIEEINQKFPKKEDAMKKQQATMDLYKKAGVSPLSGCVPMLLQFPILIAMFRFFPASIELRQQPFLWAEDLSSYDSILDLGTNIPFYGDHVSLFCLLMAISTLIYTRLNEKMMGGTNTMPGMRLMMYIMPIMFLGFFNSYASGLSYYYFLANIITFIQMFAIRYFIDEKKVRAQIEANKKKPVKKSNWQMRLEEAQKAAQSRQKK